MDNEVLKVSIQVLEQKLGELLGHYKDQKKVVQQLQVEKKQLRQRISSSNHSSVNFSKSPKSGTITKNEAQARELGRSIDGYIRDIDKSIAYLEQLQ